MKTNSTKRTTYILHLTLAYIVIGSIFISNRAVFAETLKPDPLLLELEELYRGVKKYKQLPFVLEDPHKRPKNGPTLKNVIHKANEEWLKKWISNPEKMVPNARMPRLMLNDNEIEAILAYLTSIADKELPKQEWDSYLLKSEDEMSDEEYARMDALASKGKAVWGRARCNICHPVKGKGGAVGVGPDLGAVADKINRDWLYLWVKEPKSYFPDTQMARYRLKDDELRLLVEYIMRDWDFKAEEDEEEEEEEEKTNTEVGETEEVETIGESSIIPEGTLVEKGKRIIELSRCFICHEIEGVVDLLPISKREDKPTKGFERLLDDIRCMTCHNIQGKGGSFAPELTHAGSKLKESWIRDFLQNPDVIRPLLKQMPKFNLTLEEAETATEFIEEFFISEDFPLEKFANIEPAEEEIRKGKELYDAKGCRSCHTIETGGGIGPDLKRVGDRLENGFIFFHIKDPHNETPDAIEPNYNLSDEEATAITYYLMSCRSKK
ncbi:MAG: putative (tetraheme) protein [Candidatus Scalindua rubra]|uniref:Putative (Tetraheme) protein n=1 Tax=Candidatus Scalindua rubra TaxID=1872076 RepID=A0A1E3X9A5_9BACT|nr:MAG: putative (tetraheme) protein [Candidatus Scalindua rubra]